uniref:Cytochrome c oxidase subunit 2 n=1 Tax=Nelumbo nucifera TaxID=4432 RepID=A0A822XVA3_NELNU|nr:TPA_asm: hypothetical protein HUJ06_027018 [Nelumbo nucifera]
MILLLDYFVGAIAPCDAGAMMQGILDLDHDIFFFLILILVFVSRMLVRALWHFHYQTNPIPQRIVHGTTIEILWTIFPSIIPMFIAIPSFALLYSMDEVVVDSAITIKAMGHRWHWIPGGYSDYNSSDEQSLTFGSYTIPEDDSELGQSRLLEVDNRVVVPAKTNLRIIVTPADVLHCWDSASQGAVVLEMAGSSRSGADAAASTSGNTNLPSGSTPDDSSSNKIDQLRRRCVNATVEAILKYCRTFCGGRGFCSPYCTRNGTRAVDF